MATHKAVKRRVRFLSVEQVLEMHDALLERFGGSAWGRRPRECVLFRSRLRTMHPERPPSELVVAHALRASLPEFLAAGPADTVLAKFLRRHLFRPREPLAQPRAA